jgi:hypothetical protein
MRNPLDKSSVAQSLDGNRLMGSLHFPANVFSQSAAHAQQEPVDDNAHLNGSNNHEAVRVLSEPKPFIDLAGIPNRMETNMKIAKMVVAGATLILITSSGVIGALSPAHALTQQEMVAKLESAGYSQIRDIKSTDGQGVALARTTLAAWDLINGRLVRPFDVGLKLTRTYWIVSPKATSTKPKVATFRDWLLAEAADDARRLRKLFAS